MKCTVIIPTTCESRRAENLKRAIESTGAPVMLVVNGNRFDRRLLDEMRSHHEVHYLEEGHAARARRFGRTLVSTPFFGFLDDDDEYLPGSVENRMAPMLADPMVDAVIGNGLRGKERVVPRLSSAAIDPARAMLEFNWLPSCAGLFRTETVGPEYFDQDLTYLEWTLTGFRLALTRKLVFMDKLTYRINDTPDSLSKQKAYTDAHIPVIRSMLDMAQDHALRRRVERKLSAMHHDLAGYYSATDKARARKHHIASLMGPGGLRYLPFSRKMI